MLRASLDGTVIGEFRPYLFAPARYYVTTDDRYHGIRSGR